jgi:hypothetical protein
MIRLSRQVENILGRRWLLATLLTGIWGPGLNAQSTCRPADGESAVLLGVVDSTINGRTASYKALRDSLQIPAPKKAIKPTLVTSKQTCAAAGKALDALDGTGTTARSLYVIKADTYYVVDDPKRLLGEFRNPRFFTSTWVLKGGIVQ